MRSAAYISFVVGLGLITALIAWQGAAEITRSLALAGWAMLLLAPYYVLPLLADTAGWRRLLAADQRPGFRSMVHALWVGVAVNWLLPVAQIGGEVVRARLLVRRAVAGAPAGASVVADKTVQAVTLVLYALIGLGALIQLQAGDGMVPALLAVTAALAGLIYLFYRAQRGGLFRFLAGGIARIARGRDWIRLTGGAEALDQAIREVYGRPGDFLAAVAWHMAGRAVMTGEVLFALYLLGQPVGLLEALIIDSLGQAVRGAAFLIPGALGVQEGGYLLLGQLVGVGPETALAMALMKRVRELAVGVPALVAWQLDEGRLLWRRRRAS